MVLYEARNGTGRILFRRRKMKGNEHKKLTYEDKFARKYYCKHARLGTLRRDKRQQKKSLRTLMKKNCTKED